jgi:hypothetical protein
MLQDAAMKDRYVSCYLSGRFDAFDGEIDADKLVELIWSGQPVRDVTLNAARTAIAHEADTATKLQWIKDNLEDIKTMGGDTEKSWRLYVQGRTDALAHQIEDEMMNIVEEDDDESESESESEDAEDSEGDFEEEEDSEA